MSQKDVLGGVSEGSWELLWGSFYSQ